MPVDREALRTRLVYEEDARRAQLDAEVIGHYAGGFVLDRTIFHASHPRYHHKQPPDRGYVAWTGHKSHLKSVQWRSGVLVHVPAGQTPAVGERVRAFLDEARRTLQARAHLAGHLLASETVAAGFMLADGPRVGGDGRVRIEVVRRGDVGDKALARVITGIARRIAADTPTTSAWIARDDAVRAQRPHGAPEPPHEASVRLVGAGEDCTLACDAPVPDRTGRIADIAAEFAHLRGDRAVWGLRVK